MIFSVQNSNLMYSVELSPDLVHIQVRETVSGVFLAQMDFPIQVWHMVEMMRRDFNEHRMMQVLITENQLGTMQMMEEVMQMKESFGNELSRGSWLKICGSTSRRLPLSLGGGRISRKPRHNRWRWVFLRNNDASNSTTTPSNGTSSSSAFYIEPPELFSCWKARWLNFLCK